MNIWRCSTLYDKDMPSNLDWSTPGIRDPLWADHALWNFQARRIHPARL
jgi:hypothetical protein